MSYFGGYLGTYAGNYFGDTGGTPPPVIVVARWRVRHLGLGIGLIYLPPPLPVLA